MRLDTFNAVETHYNNTKPLVSKYHTKEDDIRPLGRRDRKHERIEKRSDTEYVFHDYWFRVSIKDLQPYTEDQNPYYAVCLRYKERPPITWQKLIWKGEETEVVTVRGATMDHDTTRHNFLRQYIPWGLGWAVRSSGRHSVRNAGTSGRVDRWGSNSTFHHMPCPRSSKDRTDYLLRFTRRGRLESPLEAIRSDYPLWQCTTPEWPVTRQHVNKDRKADLREHNDKFWEWMCSIGPMLHTNWDHLSNLEQEVQGYIKENNGGKLSAARNTMSYNFWPRFPETLALEIVKDYNHPLRIHLATSFLARNDIKSLTNKVDSSRFRSTYNRWFNKQLGLMEEETK